MSAFSECVQQKKLVKTNKTVRQIEQIKKEKENFKKGSKKVAYIDCFFDSSDSDEKEVYIAELRGSPPYVCKSLKPVKGKEKVSSCSKKSIDKNILTCLGEKEAYLALVEVHEKIYRAHHGNGPMSFSPWAGSNNSLLGPDYKSPHLVTKELHNKLSHDQNRPPVGAGGGGKDAVAAEEEGAAAVEGEGPTASTVTLAQERPLGGAKLTVEVGEFEWVSGRKQLIFLIHLIQWIFSIISIWGRDRDFRVLSFLRRSGYGFSFV
ncbi:hypothetical protein Ahy_A03g012497 [Arachis hypogaea]|uniref:Uncharacterized protein n=1 Tax=Arachis hypogaea TaxID=3818 RepID=A0A445DTP4_ARAHY|nr:hypothetical protein Ahy_A03g012497 [Arachis hypogaea]